MAARVIANRDDALGDLDMTSIRDALRSRSVSPRELRDAALSRAADVDPRLNAIVALTSKDEHRTDGAFAAIPSFVKDNEELAGYPTRHGSRATRQALSHFSSPVIKIYQALGFSILGKTTLPEFGLTATTEPLATGPTRNPRNPEYSAGGSSGGSAALVAGGVVPIAHANDGGGSIRIPAACCGLVGLKPTRGRLPMNPAVDRLPVRLAVQGVVTRTVRDTALFYAQAEKVFSPALPPIGHVTGPPSRRLRIGVVTDALECIPVSPDVRATVERTAEICASLGHYVEPVANPFGLRFAMDFLRFWSALSAAISLTGRRTIGKDFDRSELEPFTRALAQAAGKGALGLPGAIRRLRQFEMRYADGIAGFDVILSPVTAHPAPKIGYLGADVDPQVQLVRLLRYACFTPVQNVTGAPAISLPLGVSDGGLPIGVQCAAGFGKDALLLSLAYQLEEAMGFQ